MSIEAMKDALITLVFARGSIEEWGGYASEYFQNKHDLKGDIIKVDKAITSLRQAVSEAEKQEPVAMQMDVIVVNLVREGINKHRARELAEHFIKHTTPQPQQAEKQEPVAWNENMTIDSTNKLSKPTTLVQEPVAWMYDRAKYRENDLRGRQWAFKCVSQTKPYMDEMVRNVTPLYTTPQPQREQDEAYKAAAYLAKAIFDSLYANKEPYVSGEVVWELCDTTVGVITQIDNMVSQFSPRHPQPQRKWVGLTPEEILEQANEELVPKFFAMGAAWANAKLKEKNT